MRFEDAASESTVFVVPERRSALHVLYPVRAEHAFPPTKAVYTPRAESRQLSRIPAFVCGPREARGRLRRRPPSAAAALRAAGPRFARLG